MCPEQNGRESDLARQSGPLSVYWNAVIDGEARAPRDLDPGLAAVVDRLHAIDSAPPLSAARQEQIWRNLIAGSVPDDRVAPAPKPIESRNGREYVVLARPAAVPVTRRTWLLTHFATAALVLLAVVSGFLVFLRPHLSPGSPAPRLVISQIDVNRAPLLPLGVISDLSLVEATFREMPPGGKPYWGEVSRPVLAPGAEDSTGAASDTGVGPMAFTVESGRVSVVASGAVAVTRGVGTKGASAETIPAGSEVALQPGDQLVAPAGVTLRRRNDGQDPATLLAFGIVDGSALSTPGYLFVGDLADLPFPILQPAPVTVGVRRLMIAPDGSVPLDSVAGLRLLYVESGTANLEPLAADGSLDRRRGYPIRAGSGTSHFDDSAERTVLVNRGEAPSVVLIATITTPPATGETVEPAARSTVEDTVIMHGTFQSVPPDADWMGIERTTLAPGARWDLGLSKNDGEGPWLYRVEAGELTIRADGPITVTRAGETQATTIPSGSDVVLRTGDQGLTPSGITSQWRNEGSVPTKVIDFGVTTFGLGFLPEGVSHVAIIDRSTSALPAPVTVAVHRVVVPARSVLASDNLPAVAMIHVETGEPLFGDGSETMSSAMLQPQGTPAGWRPLITGNTLWNIPPQWALRSAKDAATTLLILTLTDAPAPEGTPMG